MKFSGNVGNGPMKTD